MKKITDRPLYVAAFAIGGVSTLVGAVTVVSDLQGAGIPEGGSVLTLLVGLTILALAVTGPSEPSEPEDAAPADDRSASGPARAEGDAARRPVDEEAR